MVAETLFLKKLQAFLEQDLNDFEKRRIITFLEEYKEKIPTIVVKKTVEKIVYLPTPTPADIIATEEDLKREAARISERYDVPLALFMRPKKRKCTSVVTQARREFVKTMMVEFKTPRNMLIKFLNVDHSSISYYLNGKKFKYVPIKKRA